MLGRERENNEQRNFRKNSGSSKNGEKGGNYRSEMDN